MEINDTVNIIKSPNGYWKGKITSISDGTENGFCAHTNPIATVNEINGIGHAVVFEAQLEIRDGEYFQFKQ